MTDESVDFLVGQMVEQIWVWGPFRLVLHGREPQVYVDVEGPADLTAAGSRTEINFFTDGNVAESATLLSLLWKRVTGARIEGSVLCLSFEHGAELRASPWDEGESWHLVGHRHRLVCLPRGELLSI